MNRYVYSARLVPIGPRVNIPKTNDTPWYSSFTPRSFELERTEKLPALCVNHDLDAVVGRVAMLYTDRDWWCADFTLDPVLPNELDVGQPVSVGIDLLSGDESYPMLREVSIVPSGAVRGAEVTSRVALRPAASTERSRSPAAVLTSNRGAVAGDDFDVYRPPVWDELERIVGYRVTDENQTQAFLDANRTPLEKHYDEFVAAKRATSGPQVLVRPGIGQVLAVGGVPVG